MHHDHEFGPFLQYKDFFSIFNREFNPNLWNPDDVNTQEPTSYVREDEQVSALPTLKEAEVGNQMANDPKYKVRDSHCETVEATRSTLYQSQNDNLTVEQTLPLEDCGVAEEQGQTHNVVTIPSNVTIEDFGLSLSESDQAEGDFTEVCNYLKYTVQLDNADATHSVDQQAPLAVTEDDTDVETKPMAFQKSWNDVPDLLLRQSDYNKVTQTLSLGMVFNLLKSEENIESQDYQPGYLENLAFIDDENDVHTSELILSTPPYVVEYNEATQQTIRPQKSPAWMTCDSTDFCSVFSDNVYLKVSDYGVIETSTEILGCLASEKPCCLVSHSFKSDSFERMSEPFTTDTVNINSKQDEFLHSFLSKRRASDVQCRACSPDSQTSQCSFSFLELVLSEPTRAELRSQTCDYYLLYSGGNPPLPVRSSTFYTPISAVPTELTKSSQQLCPNMLHLNQNGQKPVNSTDNFLK